MRIRPALLLLAAGVVAALLGGAVSIEGARAEEPLVVSPEVMASFAEYKARQRPMYFAVSSDGLFSWYSYCVDPTCGGEQKYRREAVEACEREGGSDCLLFAIRHDIQVEYRVGDPATIVPATARPCEIETFAAGAAAGAAVASLRPGACSDFRRFGHLADFKAFATSDPLKLRSARGWSFRYKSPDDAMKGALAQCAKSQTALSVSEPCQLFAIGDIVVHGMTEAEQRAALEAYRTNKDATNADLAPGN
jgi:hypothetical protein